VIFDDLVRTAEAGSVVTSDGTGEEACVLSGFGIRNGLAHFAGGICGTSDRVRTRARIENCEISENLGTGAGAGVAFCDGEIRNNVVRDNWATGGGALWACDGVVENNTIVRNSADDDVGGLLKCNGTILNCIIWGKAAMEGSQLHDAATTSPCKFYKIGLK
jgi:hypothetical protein